MPAFLLDLRYSVRRLVSHPGFTTLVVVTLALGIGASTAIFSAVNPILFESLPYPRADRIVTVWDYMVDGSRLEVSFGNYRELVERTHTFDAIGVMKPWQPTMTGETTPERFDGQRVSVGYFRALGVLPTIGRDFDAGDDRVNGPNVVILGNGLWRRRFGADPAIVGRAMTLDGNSFTVVGVMPPAFENVLSPSAEVWAPMQYDASLPPDGREWGHHLRVVARLRPGVTIAEAGRDVDAIARTPVDAFRRPPYASMRRGLQLVALQDDVTRAVKPALLAVAGAVLLLLTIACVNVTNLLLARGAQRLGEFSMRAALGAGRARLIRQLLTESVVMAALGGGLGMVVAGFGVGLLVSLAPPGLPRLEAIGLDTSVLLFAIVLTTLIGVIVGLVPALHVSRDLQSGVRSVAGSFVRGHQTTRRVLVVAEVALAIVLLVGAGLLMRSLQRLFAIAPGFDPSNVVTMQVQVSGSRFDDPRAVNQFFARALDAARAVPGVVAAGFVSQLPLSGDVEKYGVRFESVPYTDPNEDGSVLRYAVSPGYLEAMRIPLRSGRLLDDRDDAGKPVAVLINESYAKRKFPRGDAIGQRLHLGRTDLPWYTVVGIVGDVKHTSLAVDQGAAVYIATTQWYFADRVLSLVVRGRADAGALVPAVRDAIWSVDRDQPIVRVATLDALVARSAAERRFALVLFEAFAIVALALASIGIYGILAFSVAERTREIGVRSALGASRGDILSLVVRQGMTLAAVGVAIGLASAAVASRLLMSLLFDVSRLDPATYIAVALLLAGVSAAACWLPAWRAAHVDPILALRAE